MQPNRSPGYPAAFEVDWRDDRVGKISMNRGALEFSQDFGHRMFVEQAHDRVNSRLLIVDRVSLSLLSAARITEFLPGPGPDWILEISEAA